MTGDNELGGGGDLGVEVRRVLVEVIPSSWRDDALSDDLDLLDGGVGLDSTGLLEVLVACEDAFGVELPAEELLEHPQLTVRTLVDEIVAAKKSGRNGSLT